MFSFGSIRIDGVTYEHDVVIDHSALRPEECFRLKPANVVDGKLEIHFGKTGNARRRIPITPNVQAILDMRLTKAAGGPWVFPARTRSGHIEPSSLKKQHAKAVSVATRLLRKHG